MSMNIGPFCENYLRRWNDLQLNTTNGYLSKPKQIKPNVTQTFKKGHQIFELGLLVFKFPTVKIGLYVSWKMTKWWLKEVETILLHNNKV